ncbi:MAG: hypothetical protein K940chlam7_01166 [Chlamydiae bacterium]|nr:hypothetical protein [Chlamydiota bacterium]
MDVSIFLARLFGLYLTIIAFVYFFRKTFLREVLRDFYNNSALVVVTSIINLFIGLLIILNHNIWEYSWRVVITLIGYLSLLKGILNLFAPEYGKKMAAKVMEGNILMYSGVISLALGLYLLYYGFFGVVQMFLS